MSKFNVLTPLKSPFTSVKAQDLHCSQKSYPHSVKFYVFHYVTECNGILENRVFLVIS